MKRVILINAIAPDTPNQTPRTATIAAAINHHRVVLRGSRIARSW
jgi:hypothetical protein